MSLTLAGRGGAAIARTRAARRWVAPFIVIGVVSLLLGLWAGLARIGWDLPESDVDLMLRHGGLMVVGFVATVIAVERAVAVQSPMAFAAPALSAAAGAALIVSAPTPVAPALATAAAAAYVLNIAVLLMRHRMAPFVVLLAGGCSLLVAGLVWWDGNELRQVVPWWMSFLVLTIAAERLELIRFQRFSRRAGVIGAAALLVVAIGPAVALQNADLGARLLGIGFLVGTFWLVTRDVARHVVWTDGLAQFAAAGVLTAYAWLAVTGALLVANGLPQGFEYDAVVHVFFIGFVFGAIIAHAPIIAPAVTGLRIPFTPWQYLPLIALDGALLLRIAADLTDSGESRRWAGLIQALAITGFLLLTVVSVLLGRHHVSSER